MKKFLPLAIIFVFLLYSADAYSQSRFSHEIGVGFGMASYQTDFGQRHDFPSANQATFQVGLVHYLKFFGSQYSWRSGSTFFSEHFKLKTEFNYMINKNIKHEGKYLSLEKLQRMTGEIKMYNIGTNIEFYFFELEDYASFYGNENKLNPFINVGLHYSFYDPDILVDGTSLEGKSEPYGDLIPKWQNGAIYLEKGTTFGVSAGAGIRYSISDFDLVFEGRWQHFFSDKVDGIDDTSPNTASDFRDTMIVVNVGIVYVFGKY